MSTHKDYLKEIIKKQSNQRTSRLKVYPRGFVGNWLADRMDERGESTLDVARGLHCSKGTVMDHVSGKTPCGFRWVCAYCWWFNKGDDPDDIWQKMTEAGEARENYN